MVKTMIISALGFRVYIAIMRVGGCSMDGDLLGVRLEYRLGTRSKYRRLEKALVACKEFDDWHNLRNKPNCVRAKNALVDFFKVFLKMSPDKRLDVGFRSNCNSFLINVRLLRNALEEHNYPRACNELISLFVYEPILQSRIYVCLEELYHKHLEK